VGKYKDFFKWFHCNGRPVWVKNTKIFQNDFIVMGDLPMWKNTKIFQNDLIVMGDLPKWKI
jgi:hypothetical protein